MCVCVHGVFFFIRFLSLVPSFDTVASIDEMSYKSSTIYVIWAKLTFRGAIGETSWNTLIHTQAMI